MAKFELDGSDTAVLEPPTRGQASAQGDGNLREDNAKWRQIIDGARSVFLADGFDAASMNEIARVAGVSKGTLYVYFDSKVALFEALVREERRQQAEQICIVRDDGGADIRSFLVEFAVNLATTITRPESLAHARMVLAVAAKFPHVGRAFYEAGPQAGLDRMSDCFRQKVESGDLVIEDVPHAAAQFLELCMAGLFKRAMFCVVDRLERQEIETKVAANVDVFLAAYARK